MKSDGRSTTVSHSEAFTKTGFAGGGNDVMAHRACSELENASFASISISMCSKRHHWQRSSALERWRCGTESKNPACHRRLAVKEWGVRAWLCNSTNLP